MNKEERQKWHQERLTLKREREAKLGEYQDYFWRFHAEGIRLLRQLPETSSLFQHSVALFYTPTNLDHLHLRIEWNDKTVMLTKKTWKYEEDCEHFEMMPQGHPDDPRTPEDYWEDVKPKITLERFDLAIKEFEYLLGLVANLRLPPMPPTPNAMCMDGEGYELTFCHCYAVTTWRWHCKSPESWKELETVARHIIELSDRNHRNLRQH